MSPESVAVPSAAAIEGREKWTRLAERIAQAFGLVLLLVVATVALASLTHYSGWGAVGISLLAASSAAVGLASSGLRPNLAASAVALAGVCVAFAIVAAASGRNGFLAVAALVQLVLLAWAAGAVLRAVIGESEIGFRTILGAISVYLIFGLLFTALYVAIDRLQGGPFFGPGSELQTGDFVFFSFTTLTTTGYGNLIPGGQPGRMFSVFEMLLGQIFLVTLIARLVSLWRPGRRAR
jgi:Ion channel